MLFPVKDGKAFVNSVFYRYKYGGGFQPSWIGPDGAAFNTDGGGACDTRNYQYPWQDNFCELRPGTTSSCPDSSGHKGIDVRGSVCRDNDPANVVVAPIAGHIIEIEPHYLKIESLDGTRHINIMHLALPSLTFTDVDLDNNPTGIPVSRGQVLGKMGQVQRGNWSTGQVTVITPTHLHMDIKYISEFDDGSRTIDNVSPYTTLVEAYQKHIQAGRAN